MQKLYNKFKEYTIKDAIRIEENDSQFLSIKKLSKCIRNKELFLLLIISNSLICYQLSGKGEKYWEEFSNYFCNIILNKKSIIEELIKFLKQSINNKRLLDIKINRLKKLEFFIKNFEGKGEFFYNNMIILRDELSLHMKQKNNSKTIVFSVKMFGYAARNIYTFVEYPREIFIPIDSRIIKIFEKYKGDYIDINKFYIDLSNILNIPMLHLDGIFWTLFSQIMDDEILLFDYNIKKI